MISPPENVCYPPELPVRFDALVLPMDKPTGWSSFDVVRRLRRILGVRKIGHAGTLDPMATGLLICLVGKATRQMERFMEMPKRYEGTLRLGQETDSYDADGQVVSERAWQHVDDSALEAALAQFRGEIVQRAPMFSAVKVGGERLYRKARRGETVERPLRHATIHAFDLVERSGSDVTFNVSCSRGTYVRALAHDLGEMLGCGAHLTRLRRTAIGDIDVDSSWTIETIDSAVQANRAEVG